MAALPHPGTGESGPIHICHLTVLNPARHSRIFYKEARSQAKAGYRVTVIGQDENAAPYREGGVQIVPTGTFSRLSRRRWAAPGKIVALAIEQKAHIYQIHTPELLGPARRILSAVPGARLVYDMHEDYALNIREGGYYPWWIRRWLASWTRKKEAAFTRYGHGVIYAEDCFRGLMAFPPERTATVRNKYLPPETVVSPPPFGDPSLPLLAYTGTIAENWGVLRAIELWKAMQDIIPLRLAVVGHSHDIELIRKIREMAQNSGYPERFLLVGGEKYVPYEEMAGWIAAADAGLALYTLRPNIRERIPTKFYEFMAAGKPVFHSPNAAWHSVFQPPELGLPLSWPPDPGQLEAVAMRLKESPGDGSGTISPPDAWHWESESEALMALLERILKLPE